MIINLKGNFAGVYDGVLSRISEIVQSNYFPHDEGRPRLSRARTSPHKIHFDGYNGSGCEDLNHDPAVQSICEVFEKVGHCHVLMERLRLSEKTPTIKITVWRDVPQELAA